MSKENPSADMSDEEFEALFATKLTDEEIKKLAEQVEADMELKEIKAQIDEPVFQAIKETNPYLEAKDREVELDLEKIRERALTMYISAGFPKAMREAKGKDGKPLFSDYQGLTDKQAEQRYKETFPNLKKLLKQADAEKIKQKIEKQGYNDFLVTDQRLPNSIQFELLIKQAKDNNNEPLFPNQYLDPDIKDLDSVQELDLTKITPEMIKYIEDEAKQSRYPKLDEVLTYFRTTLQNVSKPRANFKVSLTQNYQESNKDTLNQSAASLWQKFSQEQNQGMSFPDYLNLLRQHLQDSKDKKRYLDDYQKSKYYSWLVAAACPFGALDADWNFDARGLDVYAIQPGYRSSARGGRPLAALLEL